MFLNVYLLKFDDNQDRFIFIEKNLLHIEKRVTYALIDIILGKY